MELSMKYRKLSAILTAVITLTLLSAYILPAAYTNASGGISSIKTLSDSTVTDTSKVTYTCPKHPEVISDKPGTCPKCGMDLELKKKDEKEQGMNSCPGMEKCNQTDCNMKECKGNSGGCMGECPMMKEHKSDDNSKSHEHKSGCKKGC